MVTPGSLAAVMTLYISVLARSECQFACKMIYRSANVSNRGKGRGVDRPDVLPRRAKAVLSPPEHED
jgi:hypothetical protein